MKPHREEAKKFFDIDWRNRRIKWGPPVIERKVVATSVPPIEIPSNLRKAALCETLFPDFTLPSKMLSQITIQKLSQVATLSFESRMLISRQARLLLNDMDPRERCLPLVPGTSPLLISVKHALVHSNYVISDYKIPPKSAGMDWTPSIRLAVEVMIRTAREKRLNIGFVKKALDNMRIHSSRIPNIISEARLDEIFEVKWIKTLYGYPITLEHKFSDLIVCPKMEKKEYAYILNKSKAERRAPTRIELVNFKLGDLRGHFSHVMGNIISIVSNFTTHKEFLHMLTEIAFYTGNGWLDTSGTSHRDIRNQISQKVRANPHTLIRCSKKKYRSIFKYDPNSDLELGMCTLTQNTEYLASERAVMKIDDKMNLVCGTGQEIAIKYDERLNPVLFCSCSYEI